MTTVGAFPPGGVAVAHPGSTTAGVTSAGAPVRLGAISLTVRDLETVNRFYQQVIGLSPIETEESFVRLGVGATVLLELRHDPVAPVASPRAAGLFHTAFLVPTRTDLAQWVLNAAALGVSIQGASDHLVSEAIYLADPEGNGIEVYWDRPSETWAWRDGMVEMDTLALDLNGLAATVKTREWSGLPSGSYIGHVHLQVGDLDSSDRFYAGLLGLDVVCRYPGATFLSSGGYHHHIGTNIWNSRGAQVRKEPTTGLADIEIITDAGTLETVRSRLSPEQVAEAGPTRLLLRDPWGTSVTMVIR
jgi:catechol 2,3-dioxygenase